MENKKKVLNTVKDVATVVLVTIPVAAGMVVVDKILKKNK